MTRDEFIDGYVERSGIVHLRTPTGFALDDGAHRQVALPCRCGEEECDGWAMVGYERAPWHLFQNGIAEFDGIKASPE